MRSTGRSSAAIFSFESSTWIWRRRPPLVVTAATPSTRSRRGADLVLGHLAQRHAIVVAFDAEAHDRHRVRVLPEDLHRLGVVGRRPRTRSRRVRMSSIASLRSVPQVKFSDTRLLPSDECEFICSSPATALTVCSSGRVMSCSISCGPTPGYRHEHADRRVGHVRQQVDRQAGQRDAAQQDDDRADHEHRHGPCNRKSRDAHCCSSSSTVRRHR